MLEEHKASENMQKFFEKLLQVKQLVKDEMESTDNEFAKLIYEKLDEIIKEANV